MASLFTWSQNELIGSFQRSNKVIASVLNKFVMFFNKSITDFFFPMKEMLPANSRKKFNFLPDTPRETFLEVNKLGLPSFFPSLFINFIGWSCVSNCNFLFILLIVTKTYFLFGNVSLENLFIFSFRLSILPNLFTLLTYFLFLLHFFFFFDLLRVLLCPIQWRFYERVNASLYEFWLARKSGK